MTRNKDLSKMQSFEEVWPLGSGLLPSELFCDKHLYDIIFHFFSRHYKLPEPTIRQGLKFHLKRNAPDRRPSGRG